MPNPERDQALIKRGCRHRQEDQAPAEMYSKWGAGQLLVRLEPEVGSLLGHDVEALAQVQLLECQEER